MNLLEGQVNLLEGRMNLLEGRVNLLEGRINFLKGQRNLLQGRGNLLEAPRKPRLGAWEPDAPSETPLGASFLAHESSLTPRDSRSRASELVVTPLQSRRPPKIAPRMAPRIPPAKPLLSARPEGRDSPIRWAIL